MLHGLVWKCASDTPSGGDALLGWQLLERSEGQNFRRYGHGQVSELVAQALPGTIAVGHDLSIAWGPIDPATTPPDECEKLFRSLSPTILCPERPLSAERRTIERWIIFTDVGMLASFPAAAFRETLSQMVADRFPRWRPRENWLASSLLVRHATDGETEGVVKPLPLRGDRALAAVANVPAVLEANRREDPSLPRSSRELLVVRLAAQRALGVAECDLAVMFSGQVAELMAVPMTRSPFDVQGTLAALRRRFQLYYGDHAELALRFVLDNCEFSPERVQMLKEAAQATAAIAAPAA
jgi:hypothetical protein